MMLVFILFLIYLSCIAFFIWGFDRVKTFKTSKKTAINCFSVIIPFRNESENLPGLLASIEQLNYPKNLVEFLFVNDDSTDNSAKIILDFSDKSTKNIQLLKNIRSSNSPKKDAITTAIEIAKNQWITTTDADCLLPKNWLSIFDNYMQQYNCNMLVAPVTYQVNNTFFEQFQLLDFLSLQAATIGGFGIDKPFLCNGANLVYKKTVFNQLNGFKSNSNIASGDDIFLFEEFLKLDKSTVHFVKSNEVIVQTFPVSGFKKLFHQRVRWASKTANYTLPFGKIAGIIIFLGNLLVVCLPFLMLANWLPTKTAIIIFLLKFLFDFLLIKKATNFTEQKIPFLTYFFSSFCYPFFSILVVFFSIFSSYQWKGRRFKK